MKKPTYYILYIAIAIVLIISLSIYFKPTNRVLRRAKKYLGEEEKPNNSGFKNPKFEAKKRSVGWRPGDQWCNYFVRLVFLESLKNTKYYKLLKGNNLDYTKDYSGLISSNVFVTFNNFKKDKSGLFEISDKPKRGSLVVWQSKSNPSAGHIGIVERANNKYFKYIDGNANNVVVNLKDQRKNIRRDKDLQITRNYSDGMVAEHIGSYDGDGMNLLGFINFK